MEVKIISDLGDCLVCIKPFGMLSEDGGADSIITALRGICKLGSGEDIFPVHRLDRETGGLMVFAKTSRAAARLSKAVTDGKFKKTYIAEVEGIPNPPEGIMEDLLFYDRQSRKSYVVKKQRKGVKKAVLSYKTAEKRKNTSIVRIKLETGRTHQIRVQFASRLLPILGDRRYSGSKADYMRLWSEEISFPDDSGRLLTFHEDAPFVSHN